MRDLIRAAGLPVRMVDLSTSGKHSGADIPAHQVAAFHPRGAAGVFTGDRGQSVAGMTRRLPALDRRGRRASPASSRPAAPAARRSSRPAMRALPVGVPKLIVSTVASRRGVEAYVGPTDITMMHSVADVQGLNAITERGAGQRRAGDGRHGAGAQGRAGAAPRGKPAIGLTMFGVTTPCVQQVTAALAGRIRLPRLPRDRHRRAVDGEARSTAASSPASSTSPRPRSAT